ncbi:hypothetical protein [Viridibacterium curvum]|uniref:Uncharacterized protein n=1 Tax=Viridibacterium curvum TaxID=1101404 RepID=A0ABP9QQ90_9RHOO
MSQDLSLHLPKDRLPSTRTWNRLLREAGFKFKLPADLEPAEDQGWLPCDSDIGFDYASGPLDEVMTGGPNGTPVDWGITLECQSDASWAAAHATLACLAGYAGGYVLDMQTGEELTAADALARAMTLQQALSAKTRQPNPFSTSLRTILKPELEQLGFKKLSSMWFYRVKHLTCQYVYFEKDRHDPMHYRASCFIQQLLPRKAFVGGWKAFPVGLQFMPYGTPKEATTSMQIVLDDIQHVALPDLAQFDTLEQLAGHFLSAYAEAEYLFPLSHEYASSACVLAFSGNLGQGRRLAEFARRAYLDTADDIWQGLNEMAKKPDPATKKDLWPYAYAAMMDELLAAIDEGRHMALLTEWRRESLKAAKVAYEEV